MDLYKTKKSRVSGMSYRNIYLIAREEYRKIKNQTKRKPYVRSKYFNKDKVFMDYFWAHLKQKSWKDRRRRLKFYSCAVELIKENKFDPETREDTTNSNIMLHRFKGVTKNNIEFFVQIKENKKNNQKYFLSVFPKKDK
ncbi:MAG TPA: hypothetical protein ENJ27_01335 [Candidatus Moranbacteria bacterium]|nr:hypothetical protein [Candidatus Moranbacteria bacterium]